MLSTLNLGLATGVGLHGLAVTSTVFLLTTKTDLVSNEILSLDADGDKEVAWQEKENA